MQKKHRILKIFSTSIRLVTQKKEVFRSLLGPVKLFFHIHTNYENIVSFSHSEADTVPWHITGEKSQQFIFLHIYISVL